LVPSKCGTIRASNGSDEADSDDEPEEEAMTAADYQKLSMMKAILAPLTIRRDKEILFAQLKEKTEQIISHDLSERETKSYKRLEEQNKKTIHLEADERRKKTT
jgi:SNF2 family DNA or RNA helicase